MANSVLEQLFANGQTQPLHVAALVSVCVFLLALLAAAVIRERNAIRRRTNATVPPSAGGGDRRSLRYAEETRVSALLARASQLFAPTKREEITTLRKQLVRAGFLSPSAIPIYYGIRVVVAASLPILFFMLSHLLPYDVPGYLQLVFAAGLVVVGLIVPSVLLDWRRGKMRERYSHTFPDLMDLLVVCIESGQSLNGAIERVGKEIVQSCPEFGANLHLVSLELRAGRTLTDALNGLFERTGVEEIKSLKVLLKQSEELGASIARTLRVYSDEMRDKRLMRAEAKAHALPVKMTLPLGLFIFPVVLMVVMVPVVIRIMNAFEGM